MCICIMYVYMKGILYNAQHTIISHGVKYCKLKPFSYTYMFIICMQMKRLHINMHIHIEYMHGNVHALGNIGT